MGAIAPLFIVRKFDKRYDGKFRTDCCFRI